MHAALEHRENTLQNPDAVMEEYKRTGDLNLRNQLVLHYAPYVKAAIYSMRSLLYSNIPAEDFFNQGILALIECIERFNISRGVRLDTYMYKVVRGRLINYARKENWLPNRVWNAAKRISATRTALEARLMRTPTDKEIAEEMGISYEEYERLRVEISTADTVSYEEMLEQSWDSFSGKTAESTQAPIDEGLMHEEMQSVLAKAIDALPPRHKQVIALCYYENLNLREIGEVLGLTQQRVSQIRASALKKLQAAMKEYDNS